MRKITQGPPDPALPPEGIRNVKHFLAVANGKSGVGAIIELPLTTALSDHNRRIVQALRELL
jgi:hypothetical protein